MTRGKFPLVEELVAKFHGRKQIVRGDEKVDRDLEAAFNTKY